MRGNSGYLRWTSGAQNRRAAWITFAALWLAAVCTVTIEAGKWIQILVDTYYASDGRSDGVVNGKRVGVMRQRHNENTHCNA